MSIQKVSVIMGVYNNEKTLPTSINSILRQTYSNWEFVICDDGSTDSSYEILTSYMNRYPDKFIILKNNKNIGLTKTLNICLKNVTGEYVARMDGDDESLPMRFERQVDFLNNNAIYSIVGCNINKFDENGVWGTYITKEKPLAKDLLWGSIFVHPSVMVRITALKAVDGYRAEEKTNLCEDYDLWLRMYSNGCKGYNIQDVLLNYYEGQYSYPKRTFKRRINVVKIQHEGFKALKLFPIGYIYLFKTILVGIIPRKLLVMIVRIRDDKK